MYLNKYWIVIPLFQLKVVSLIISIIINIINILEYLNRLDNELNNNTVSEKKVNTLIRDKRRQYDIRTKKLDQIN